VNAARPVVGIAGAGYVVPRFWGELEVRGVPTSYVDAVAVAGGRPVILPPGHALDALDLVDAVVLAGGDDVGVDLERDQAEMALLQAARQREVPLLGVCRGLQLLSVADGGSLVNDLGADLPHVLPDVGHPVVTGPGSVLASLLGESPTVSSLHHQGVATLGPGWRATARAPDGLLEGAEWIGEWDAMGVQWHPEKDATGPALFGWLVATAAHRRPEPVERSHV
jgi:putative glutamine amidotransferase